MSELNPLPEHIRVPHLRPIQPIPMEKDGQKLVALRDPAMLVKQTMVVPVQAMQVLQLFTGDKDIDTICEALKAKPEQITGLAQGLDKLGLLWGPTFEKYETEVKTKIEERGAFPAGAAANLGEDEATCRQRIDQWLDETEDPELEETVIGLVAPHLDYDRGWPNYAAAYKCIEKTDKPDRVIVLGVNHSGLGDGVVLSPFGFNTQFGKMAGDDEVIQKLIDTLGRPLIIDQLDHLAEHSIALHIPWLQHRWGDVPVVAALVPDPLRPMIEDDGERVSHGQFIETLREILDEVGGNSFFVSSADLSHVGPQFGEPRPVDDQRKEEVERHDREMMSKFLTGDSEEFLGAMKWSNNPTRWCSVGNMSAVLDLAKPESVELIDYRQASDEKGMVMVTSAAMALLGE